MTMVLAIGEIITGAAPIIEQPRALARLFGKEFRRPRKGFGTPFDARLGVEDKIGPVHGKL
jgi:hypothetical protein